MSDIPSEAFGSFFKGRQPDPEDLRFWRLIDNRSLNLDGTQEITLACGHVSTQVIPFPDTQEYAPCSQCIDTVLLAMGWAVKSRG